MIRVLIVEDHDIMRESLVLSLQDQPDIEVCGAFESAERSLTMLPTVQADLALIDVSLSDMSGIDLLWTLKQQRPDLCALMLSGHAEPTYVVRALAAGASGYVLKGRASEIPVAIREVIAGRQYLSPALEHPDNVR